MSKLLDLLQRISDGSPAPIGFGAARAGKLPGLALVGRANRPAAGRRPTGVPAAVASLDAVIVANAEGADYLKRLGGLMGDLPWGPGIDALAPEDARACGDGGADLVAFGLDTPAAATGGEDDLARLVTVTPDLADRELRAVAALPVDGFILDMTAVAGPWTLRDLVAVGSLTRRTDKHVLVQVGSAPSDPDLEALRDMGVGALIIDLAAVSAAELATLKSALLAMPRPRRRGRERMRATVPGAGFAAAAPPAREDDDEDDYDDYGDE